MTLSSLINKVVVTKQVVTSVNTSQKCSNVCGIVVMCMAAIMSESWVKWLNWNNIAAPTVLLNPTLYSVHLRINVLSWIVQDRIDITTLRLDADHRYLSSCIASDDSMYDSVSSSVEDHSTASERQAIHTGTETSALTPHLISANDTKLEAGAYEDNAISSYM